MSEPSAPIEPTPRWHGRTSPSRSRCSGWRSLSPPVRSSWRSFTCTTTEPRLKESRARADLTQDDAFVSVPPALCPRRPRGLAGRRRASGRSRSTLSHRRSPDALQRPLQGSFQPRRAPCPERAITQEQAGDISGWRSALTRLYSSWGYTAPVPDHISGDARRLGSMSSASGSVTTSSASDRWDATSRRRLGADGSSQQGRKGSATTSSRTRSFISSKTLARPPARPVAPGRARRVGVGARQRRGRRARAEP